MSGSDIVEDKGVTSDLQDSQGTDEICSTKRPIGKQMEKPSKLQKKEAQEDSLLEKAIACMKRQETY